MTEMTEDTAVVWIRDGVLVDRMPENAVAFAIASWRYTHPDLREDLCIEDLINWGFEKSGVSAAEKMQLFNLERREIVTNIIDAAAYYTALVEYFDGSVELLRDLQAAGVKNYITSAVNPRVLDKWRDGQGKVISGYLSKILGSCSGFQKGRDHFAYIQNQGAAKIYYIADGEMEIRTGNNCENCGVVPVGFAHVINSERAVEAFDRLIKVEQSIGVASPYPIKIHCIHPEKLVLPDAVKLESNLAQAGAKVVIGGTKQELMENLRNYFVREKIL